MYLVNYLSLQAVQQLFISISRYRTGVALVGVRDGVNVYFTLPGGETYVHNLPFLSVQVYLNGVRLALLDDYIVVESGGFGSGYDSVVLQVAPRLGDKVSADYIIGSLP